MNSRAIKKLVFSGSKKYEPNTFIGGVGGDITTKHQLASVLGISANWISRFEIVGSDVHCRIFRTYDIRGQAFGKRTGNPGDYDYNVTFYHDLEGKVNTVGDGAFGNCDNFIGLESESVTEFGSQVFRKAPQGDCNFPNLIKTGDGIGYDSAMGPNFIAPKLKRVGVIFLASNTNKFSLVDLRSMNQDTGGNPLDDSYKFFRNAENNRRATFFTGAIVKIHEDLINNTDVLYAQSEGATIQVYDVSGNYDYDL